MTAAVASRVALAPIKALVWLVWSGPGVLWSRMLPDLRAAGRERLVWLPWIVVVLALVLNFAVSVFATSNSESRIVAALESGRVAVAAKVTAVPQGVSTWASEQTARNMVLGPLIVMFFGLAAVFLGAFLFVGPFAVARSGQKKRDESESHGTAFWGTMSNAADAGMLNKQGEPGGLALGRFDAGLSLQYDPKLRTRRHVLTCAPTRSGKGVGCVIPHLLDYPGSVFCVDIKGENAAVTAKRRAAMGQKVSVIDPFGVTGLPSRSVNWIDWLDVRSPECVSEAAALAEMLVVRGSGEDSFWDDSAQTLLQGLLLHVASLPESERHPGRLREILTLSEDELKATLEFLSQDTDTAFGIVARTARTTLQKADKERSGVFSTAQRHTAFLDDPRIVENSRRSEVDFGTLKTELTTVYLVMPPDKLRSQSRYVRAIVYLALRGVMRVRGQPKLPVTFLLDEFPQLGRMNAVEDAISLVAGYGAWLWLFVQDLSQLKSVYMKWETFVANTTLQAFGTQDQFTARYLSEAVGAETITVASENSSKSAPDAIGKTGSKSQGTTAAHHGRLLLMPDEIRRQKNDKVIVLEQGQPPYLLQRLDYRTDKEFAGKADANPMYGAAKAAG